MRRTRLSRSAAAYFRDEIQYLAERNVAAARNLRDRLDTLRVLLIERRSIGEPSNVPGLRRFVDAKLGYVFLYRIVPRGVEIASIGHGRPAPRHDARPAPQDEVPEYEPPSPGP